MLLTFEETAKYLNVKHSWLRSAVFNRDLPYYKMGRLLRFDANDLEIWLDKNKVSMQQSPNGQRKGYSESNT